MSKLRSSLAAAGVSNASDYSGHFFRRGGATALFAAGVISDVIKTIGDWKSECYLIYIYCEISMVTKFDMLRPLSRLLY